MDIGDRLAELEEKLMAMGSEVMLHPITVIFMIRMVITTIIDSGPLTSEKTEEKIIRALNENERTELKKTQTIVSLGKFAELFMNTVVRHGTEINEEMAKKASKH